LQLWNASRKGVQAATVLESYPSPADRLFSFCEPGDRRDFLLLHHFSNFQLLRASFALILLAVLLTIPACSGRNPSRNLETTSATRQVLDEAGRQVTVPVKIERIVSLAPNLTEIVYAVGAGDLLVGNTEYCDYPAAARSVAKIGDTMHPSVERIIALKPQVVLVSTASQLEAFTKQLDQQGIAVYITNPGSLDEVFHSITVLGDMFGHHDGAVSVVQDLRRRTVAVEVAMRSVKPVKVFYQVSGEPLYTIGREAYLTDLVRRAGGVSVTADVPGAFPRFSDEAALAARPEAVILPSGGSMGTANSKVAAALKDSPAVQNNRVYKINDDHLSRPGPRLIDGLEELVLVLHPEAATQFGKSRIDEAKPVPGASKIK
jgi:iron complex transport system substrate-binding protein